MSEDAAGGGDDGRRARRFDLRVPALALLALFAFVPAVGAMPLPLAHGAGPATDTVTAYTRVITAVLLLLLARVDPAAAPELAASSAALGLTGLGAMVLGLDAFTDPAGRVLGVISNSDLEVTARSILPAGLAIAVALPWERPPVRSRPAAAFALSALLTAAVALAFVAADALIMLPAGPGDPDALDLSFGLLAVGLLVVRPREDHELWRWALLTAVAAAGATWITMVTSDFSLAWYAGLALSLLSAAAVLVGMTLDTAARMQTLSLLRVRRDYDARMEELALLDAPTGLPNAHALAQRVDGVIAAGREAAVVTIALEGLDSVYEAFGPQRVDVLVRAAADRLAGQVPGAWLARTGDEEVALVLEGRRRDLVSVAAAAAAALDEPLVVGDTPLTLGASAGCAVAPRDAGDGELLLRRALRAARTAQLRGRQAIEYVAGMEPHTPDDLRLLSELRSAIGAGELVLYYQPKARTRDRTVVGVEGLVRWQHPARGLLPPAAFIPLAERTDVINDLTRWAVTQACARAASWRQQGIPLSIAVNLPARTLGDRELALYVEEALDASGADPAALRLEVTESGAMQDIGRGSRRLASLRALGVGLAIDDFGTGYSSLAYLARLPVDEVKIDASFVWRMREDSKAATIVRSSIELCHQLGFVATAEGAEDEATWSALAAAGCDMVQGYFVGRPLPPDDLLAQLRSTGWALAE